MLNDRKHAGRNEPRRTDDTACASQLANLDCGARAANFDRATCFGRLDRVLAGSA